MKNQWGLQGQKPYESEEIDVGIDVPSHFKVLQLKWTEIISTSLTDLKMDMNIICLNIFVTLHAKGMCINQIMLYKTGSPQNSLQTFVIILTTSPLKGW